MQRFTTALLLSIASFNAFAEEPSSTIAISHERTHTFPSSAPSEQHFEYLSDGTPFVLITRQGLDLTVEHLPPNGERRAVNSPLSRFGVEIVAARDPTPGAHRFKVTSNEMTDAAHPSSVQIRLPTPAAFDAYEQIDAATQISESLTPEQRIQHLQRAAVLAEGAADQAAHAHALFAMAQVEYWDLTDWTKAEEFAQRAADVFDLLGEPHSATGARQLLSLAKLEKALERSQTTDAEDAYRLVLSSLKKLKSDFEKQGAERDAAVTLGYIGTAHFYQSHWDESATHWRAAAQRLHQLGEYGDERQSVSNLAILDLEQGRFFGAIDGVNRVLELTAQEDTRMRAAMLELLGTAYRKVGNTDESLQASLEALTLHQNRQHKPGIANSLTSIGSTYLLVGEFERAKDYLVDASAALSELNEPRLEAFISRGLARAYRELAEPELALAADQRALELVKVPAERARARLSMAQTLRDLAQYDEARDQLHQTMQFAEESNVAQLRARTSLELGQLAATLRQPEAVTFIKSAIDQFAALSDYQGLVQANLGLAEYHLGTGSLQQAVGAAEHALGSVERLRDYVSDPQLKAVYLSSSRGVHELLTQTLVRLAEEHPAKRDYYVRKAWDIDETARARTLLDLVQEQFDPTGSAAADEVGARRQSITKTLIENLARKRDLLAIDDPGTMAELADVEQRIREIQTSLEVLEAQARDGPNTGAAEPTLSSSELQSRLPNNTAMIRYALGEEVSLVWLMTDRDLIVRRLPSRGKIAEATRNLHSEVRKATRGGAAKAKLDSLLAAVTDLVWSPVQSEAGTALDGIEHLLVLPDGALHYLPFVSLSNDANGARIGNRYSVSYLPSASAAAALWRINRAKPTPAQTIAVFADPVTERGDPRLETVVGNTERPAITDVPRLAGTAREARLLTSLTQPEERMIVQSFQATRARATSADLANFRYLHFATHGRIDTQYPQLSSLILSQYQSDGSHVTGELRQADIYNMNLAADLVVMSACNTALGREIRGEGLVGLTHAFIAAGARQVLASLWQLPDQATANFMTVFYGKLFSGVAPASALQQTQMEMAAKGLFKHPYYWAGFVLHTDLALTPDPS